MIFSAPAMRWASKFFESADNGISAMIKYKSWWKGGWPVTWTEYYDKFYDWSGWREEYDFDKPETVKNLVKWSDYKRIDPVHYDRIVRDVIE